VAKRIRIGISACLLGHAVRYDGAHKGDTLLCQFFSEHSELVPFCPEVAAGMGVPRPKIQWTRRENHIAVRQLDMPTIDVTDMLYNVAEQQRTLFSTFDGVIFKSRSPSCAVNDAPVLLDVGDSDLKRAGAFSERIQQLLPTLLVIDETQLQTEYARLAFLQKVFAYSSKNLTK
jgi:uncharacterized protein YbbK (DUF523 family)